MKSLLLASIFTASLAFGLAAPANAHSNVRIYFGYPHYSYQVAPDYLFRTGYGWYQPGYGNYHGNRQEQVCLVTFFKRSQVSGGADVNVQRAQILPRRVAAQRDGPNDRRRIFDYGSNRQTRETCRYLNNINN